MESVESVLNRLHRYYFERAVSSGNLMHNTTDFKSALEFASSATCWDAKREAIETVAKNLEITLKGQK